MKFENYIQLNNQFQNSINLSLDLKDTKKVNTYIPTTVGNDFLKKYLDDVLLANRDKSTLVIAPYGKGKSHAILVLLNLLNRTQFDDITPFIESVGNSDDQLLDKICKVEAKKYLPVIISHTRGTLNQSMMNSLKKALKEYNLKDIQLNTDYTEAIERIDNWKDNYKEVYVKFAEELKKERVKASEFVRRLANYDESAYELFCKIHKVVVAGVDFVPSHSLEVVEYYNEVKNKIKEKYGYDGIYIIFDEFSKFIESRDKEYISNDMKIIQDLSELCNASTDNSMYFLMVLHKPISTYRTLDSDIKNAFKGIEGRVSTYYFQTSLKNSFELVFNAVKKNDNYNSVKKSNSQLNAKIAEALYTMPAFTTEFDKDYIRNDLIDNCYPLSPVTLYMLIKINERIAQNERTLFTFLIKQSPNSLSTIVKEDYPYDYILPSLVFDYFEKNLLEDVENEAIHRIALSAATAISFVEKEEEIEFIKSLALMLIINEKAYLPTTDKNLFASILVDSEQGNDIIKALEEKNIIVRRRDGRIEFKINMNKDVQSEISNLANTKFSRIRLAEELNSLNTNKYVYPRFYNINNKITRYFKVEYIEEDAFLAMPDLNEYFVREYNDGVILNVIRTKESHYADVLKKTEELDNPRLLVVYPENYIDYTDLIKNIKAVTTIKNNSGSEEQLLVSEYDQILNDYKNELEEKLNASYSIYDGKCSLINTFDRTIKDKKRALSRERILGDILSATFEEAPVVNLELLNKENVKANYKSARIELVSKILKGYLSDEDCINDKTSPIDTIIRCLLVDTGIKPYNATKQQESHVISTLLVFDDFLKNKEGNFGDLYDTLKKPPYGVRKGIIPVILSLKLAAIKDSLIVFYKNIEVELTEDIIERINDEPTSYTYKLDEESNEKEIYLKSLAQIFAYGEDKCSDYSYALMNIQKWYQRLPKFTKGMIGKDSVLSSLPFKKFKKCFGDTNPNASEFVLEKIPAIFNHKDFDMIADLKNLKYALDSHVNNYLEVLKNQMIDVLELDSTASFDEACKQWLEQHQAVLDTKVLPQTQNSFITYINNLDEKESDEQMVSTLVFYMTGLHIEDWSQFTISLFENELNELVHAAVETVEDASEIVITVDGKTITKSFNDELDDMTEMLENILVDNIEDFGDSISNEQKLALLVKIMKKYM